MRASATRPTRGQEQARLSGIVNRWMGSELTVYSGTVLDLTDDNVRAAMTDALKTSLRAYLEARGFYHTGISITYMDDVRTRVSASPDAPVEITDLVRVMAIVPGFAPVTITRGGWSTFSFDVDGDGR